jgi:hypothetical protein
MWEWNEVDKVAKVLICGIRKRNRNWGGKAVVYMLEE